MIDSGHALKDDLVQKANRYLIPALLLVAVIFSMQLLMRSTGTAVQDEVNHFLISRHAWESPHLMLHIWGRPANTLVYMLPALWEDLRGARIFSLLLSLLTVWLTMQTAKQLGLKWLFLIPLFTFFQPWFMSHSYLAITEVPFSLYLIAGGYFWLRGKWTIASICFGLLPLTRHEGIVILGVWGLYCLFVRNWKGAIISTLPYGIYNFLYFVVFSQLPFEIFLNTKPTTFYGSGGWFHFLPPLIQGTGIPVFLLAVISAIWLYKLKRKTFLFVVYASYYLTHVIIYRYGLFASGGYSLFLVPLAPGIALAAAVSIESMWEFLRTKNVLKSLGTKIALITVLLGVCIWVLVLGMQVKPWLLSPEEIGTQEAAKWIRENRPDVSRVVSTHTWFHYFYDLPWPEGRGVGSQTPLNELYSGDLVVWDAHYSDRLGFTKEQLTEGDQWEELVSFQNNLVMIFG